MITLLTILTASFLGPMAPSESIVKANADAATANPHHEAVWRKLYENESAASPDPALAGIFRMCLTLGPTMTANIVLFAKPKGVRSAAEESEPTGIDVLFDALAKVERDAVYENVVRLYLDVQNGTIKSTGGLPVLPDGASAHDALGLIQDAFTSQQFFRTVDEEEFDGRSPDMIGKKCKLGFGIFFSSRRTDAKKAAERKAAAKAAASAIPVTVAVTSPAPDGE
jgi:hypothetical protein